MHHCFFKLSILKNVYGMIKREKHKPVLNKWMVLSLDLKNYKNKGGFTQSIFWKKLLFCFVFVLFLFVFAALFLALLPCFFSAKTATCFLYINRNYKMHYMAVFCFHFFGSMEFFIFSHFPMGFSVEKKKRIREKTNQNCVEEV